MKDVFRKSTFCVITVLFLSFFVLTASALCGDDIVPPSEALNLTLEDSMLVALRNNKDIQTQEEEIAYARAGIQDAFSKFLPFLSVGYGFTYNNSVFTIGSLPPQKKDYHIFTGYKSDNKVTLDGSQIIYDGGASIANYKQMKVQLKIQQETLRARRLQVEFDTKRLFYGILLAYETLRITQYLVDQAQAHYEDVRTKYEQGTSSRFDVLQSKVQVSKLIPQLVQAKNAIQILDAEFKQLLFLKLDDVIRIRGSLNYFPMDISERDFLAEAYKNNPEMHLKKLGIDLNKWAIEFAKSGYYPNITASGSYVFNSNDLGNMFNQRHSYWNAGVKGSVTVFDGFSTKAKVDEARARYAQAVLGEEDIAERIAVNIRKGCLDMHEAHAVILSQKDSVGEAKEALKISYISYDNGVDINLDVIDSQVSLSQVEKNLASAIYDYIMAKAFLDQVMGREYMEEITNGKK